MLVLFDVDGTLLLSDGAGRRAMEAAASELLGRPVSCASLSFGGKLDPLIWREIAAGAGVRDAEALHPRFRTLYVARFLADVRAAAVAALPGVAALLEALEQEGAAVTLGLLTGNYPETGRAKVDAAGLDSARFRVGAWGDDGARREDLLPVARRRFEEAGGRSLRREEIVVVGDTPADVACAAAHGCRSLAVATGGHSREELAASGATLAVPSLEETGVLRDWVLAG